MLISKYVKYPLLISVVFWSGEEVAECFGVFQEEHCIMIKKC